MGYSPERKEAALKKMLPPNNVSIAELAKQEGISERDVIWLAPASQKYGSIDAGFRQLAERLDFAR